MEKFIDKVTRYLAVPICGIALGFLIGSCYLALVKCIWTYLGS